MRKWNFCAGPAVISEEVLKEVQSEILEFDESGMSVMEMSHRSDIYSKVAFDAKKDLINLLISFAILTRSLLIYCTKSISLIGSVSVS